MNEYRGWTYSIRTKISEGFVECYLSFYRQMEDRDWYDEVRYDSHERKRGQRVAIPHFHVKLHGSSKDPEQAESDLMEIIDDLVPKLLEVTER